MPLPDTMTYIAVAEPGGPEAMQPAQGPLPQLANPDEVLIRVLAAGVNRPDVAQRQGKYPPPPGASAVLGLEVSGEVVAVGPAAEPWKVGDTVCALTNGGGYAEYAIAPAAQCLPWPAGFDALLAGALPENYFTVWANLFGHGRLQAGERALIHGGSSGIGLTAIQLAVAFGATAYATAGSADKCAACERYGAAAAINYRAEDFAAVIKSVTESRGVDVVLDMVGGDYIARDLRCLAMDGRLVFIAFLQGSIAEKFDFLPVMLRRLTITGSTMRPRTAAQKGQIARDLFEHVWPLLEEGRAGPVIHQVFPLAQVVEAHRLMESSLHIGKIMLQVATA